MNNNPYQLLPETKSPIFFDPDDGLWHYYQKCLSQDLQIEYTLSPSGYDTPDEAMEQYLEDSRSFKKQMQDMKNQQPKKKDFRSDLLSWYHDQFLPSRSNATGVVTSYVVYHFILPNIGTIGEKTLPQITPADLDGLISSLHDCCDTAEAQTYKFLKSYFTDAEIEGKITKNPMVSVQPRRFNQEQRKIPPYTEKELQILLKNAVNSDHFLEIILMLLGLRTGEIRELSFSDFDETEKTIAIRRQIVRKDTIRYLSDGNISVTRTGIEIKATKTRSSIRTLRVPDVVFALLHEREDWINRARKDRESDGKFWNHDFDSYICVSNNGNIKSEGTFISALKRICTAASIPIVSPHDLRHITATWMFQYGINHGVSSDIILGQVSKYLGHSSTNTTFDVYMDYIQKKSRIRNISERVIDPFLSEVSTD